MAGERTQHSDTRARRERRTSPRLDQEQQARALLGLRRVDAWGAPVVAAALAVAVHGYASRLDGLGPVPPTVLAGNVRRVLRSGPRSARP